MDENGKKLGKFVGKIRATGSNDTDLKSITVNMHSTSVFDDGDKTGMTVATNTTSNFDSYEEKWSQWYLLYNYIVYLKTIMLIIGLSQI